jgi:hypothetical protein
MATKVPDDELVFLADERFYSGKRSLLPPYDNSLCKASALITQPPLLPFLYSKLDLLLRNCEEKNKISSF